MFEIVCPYYRPEDQRARVLKADTFEEALALAATRSMEPEQMLHIFEVTGKKRELMVYMYAGGALDWQPKALEYLNR